MFNNNWCQLVAGDPISLNLVIHDTDREKITFTHRKAYFVTLYLYVYIPLKILQQFQLNLLLES